MRLPRHPFLRGVFAGGLVWIAATMLHAQTPTTDALRDLETALRQDIAQQKTDSGPTLERRSMGPMMLSQLRNNLESENFSNRENALDQIATYFQSDGVRAAVEKLRTAIRSENEAREKAALAEVQTVLAEAARAVQSAHVPADLDETLIQLTRASEHREEASRRDSGERTGRARLQSALRFTTSWQTFLADRTAGEWSQAVQTLQNITTAEADDLLPRSQVLARLDEARRAVTDVPANRCREIMSRTRSLDDLTAAIDALAEVRAQDQQHTSYNDLAPSLSDQLSALRSTYRDFQAGIGSGLNLRSSSNQNVNQEAVQYVRPLLVQMLRLVCPRYLSVKEVPRDDELIDAYLDRIDAQAAGTLDARLMERVHQLRAQVDGAASGYQPSTGLSLLVSARNQEDAGQFEAAVVSYERALKTGGSPIPAQAVGARLDAIKKAHPDEYGKGLQRFLATPEPTAPTYFGNRAGERNSVLVPGVIPAATPAPESR